MKIFQLIIVISLATIINSLESPPVSCQNTPIFLKQRSKFRETLKTGRTMYFIVDYGLSADQIADNQSKLEIFYLKNSTIHLPMTFTYESNFDSFILDTLLSIGLRTSYVKFLNQPTFSLNDEKNCRIKQNCENEKVETLKFELKGRTYEKLALLHACQVKQSKLDSEYEVEQMKILLTEGMDEDSLPGCLDNLEFKNLTFLEFGVQGFCICRYLSEYINDCQVKDEGDFWWMLIVALMFAGVIIGVGLYEFLVYMLNV